MSIREDGQSLHARLQGVRGDRPQDFHSRRIAGVRGRAAHVSRGSVLPVGGVQRCAGSRGVSVRLAVRRASVQRVGCGFVSLSDARAAQPATRLTRENARMTLVALIDVAVGLIFTYLLLGLIASALQETTAAVMQWRGKALRD